MECRYQTRKRVVHTHYNHPLLARIVDRLFLSPLLNVAHVHLPFILDTSFATMVGWVPWDLSLRRERAVRLLDRIKRSQECGPEDVPLILQYDHRCGDLRGWVW